MGVRRPSITLVMVALVTKIHCLLEQPLQSLEPIGGERSVTGTDKPLLQEFYDHAEYKGLASKEEEMMETLPTTELPEPLPTPVAVKLEKSDAKSSGTEKKLSVPKKGVPTKKSSVVPKKEVHFIPSVVAKKGADPESSTPSVSPRKGVEMAQDSLVHNLLLVSSDNMNNTNIAPLSTDDINNKNDPAKIDEIKKEVSNEKEAKETLNIIPIPQLVKEKSNDTLVSVKGNSSHLSDSVKTISSGMPSKSESVTNIAHFKPTTADDAGAVRSEVSYAPIFMIVALVLLVVVVVAVGYHRLKDVWARRHYDYVDFLIDGMYE